MGRSDFKDRGADMTTRATGTFETSFAPLVADDESLGRMRVTKSFEGDLVGSARAEMLSVGTAVDGSAGYVAIDRITGSLHGQRGSFVLQHSGVMDRGEGVLRIVVVPDSGTEELVGLRGDFEIQIEDGLHRYVFDYAIDPSPPAV
jgi:Protein of unknown function (DUF3224)